MGTDEVNYVPMTERQMIFEILQKVRDIQSELLRVTGLVDKYAPVLEAMDSNPIARMFLRKGH